MNKKTNIKITLLYLFIFIVSLIVFLLLTSCTNCSYPTKDINKNYTIPNCSIKTATYSYDLACYNYNYNYTYECDNTTLNVKAHTENINRSQIQFKLDSGYILNVKI